MRTARPVACEGVRPLFRYDETQTRLRSPPFRPPRIIATDGLKYDITHPDLVVVGFRDMVIGRPHQDHPGPTTRRPDDRRATAG